MSKEASPEAYDRLRERMEHLMPELTGDPMCECPTCGRIHRHLQAGTPPSAKRAPLTAAIPEGMVLVSEEFVRAAQRRFGATLGPNRVTLLFDEGDDAKSFYHALAAHSAAQEKKP